MEQPIRELDQIRAELDRLQERSIVNSTGISAHEAVCEERYLHISECLEAMRKNIKETQNSISRLEEVASQGRTSLRTVLWLGGLIGGITGLALAIYDIRLK